MNLSRREIIYFVLGGLFVTNALLGEIIGVKLISLGPYTMTMGVIPWPVVFITTDLVNEYFGREGVKKLTYLTVGLILYAFLVIYLSMLIPAAGISPVNDEVYNQVFGQSLWIIVGSITAFIVSQLIDVSVFWFFRGKTGGKMLWLRATGSTIISQLIDTFLVMGIAFWLPGKMTTEDYFNVSLTNYTYKILVALSITPIIYISHSLIDRYFKKA
ncbi:MAG: queuosine precursor transporter [Bdellovibrionota bacterium]